MTGALSLFDRALTVTESDRALNDLRLLLQVNNAVTLGDLDRYEEAVAVAGQARHLADQVGRTFRLTQAHSALGQLLFETGRWDGALSEVEIVPENPTHVSHVLKKLDVHSRTDIARESALRGLTPK